MELEVWTFCVRCFQRDPSRPCQYCAGRIPGDDNCVTAALWCSSSKQPPVWVPVRPPPSTTQHQYMVCPKGRQCENKVMCPRAHSNPPEAEIAYWNVAAPPNTRQRTLDALVTLTPSQAGHLEQLLTRILNIEFTSSAGQRQLNKAFAQGLESVPLLSPYIEVLGWDPVKKHFQPPPWDSSNLIQLILGITEGLDLSEVNEGIISLLRDEGPMEGKFILAKFYTKHKKPLVVRTRDKAGHEKLRDVLWELSDHVVVSDDKKSFSLRLKSQSTRSLNKANKSSEWKFRTPPHITAKFTLCKNLPNCHYGNDCNFAHSPPELTEWNFRARLRQIKSELHQQTARMQETDLHKQVRKRVHGNLRQLPQARDRNTTALSIRNVAPKGRAKPHANRLLGAPMNKRIEWVLRITSKQPDILHRVAVSHPERKEWAINGVFTALADGSRRKKLEGRSSGEQELILNAALGPAPDGRAKAVEVSVVFDGKHTGKHEQWILFQVKDFVTSYCFTIEVLDTNSVDLKKKRLKDKTHATIQFLSGRPKALETKQFFASRSIGSAELNSSINEMPVLHWAVAFHCSVATIDALLAAGCDATKRDSSGQTPLHIAAASHQVEVVKLLAAKHKSLVDVKDKDGWAPINLAGVNTSWPAVLELVKRGADINALDGDGSTLLHRASIAGNRGVVAFLIDLGASTQTKDADGHIPYTKALHCDQDAVAQMLRSASNTFAGSQGAMHGLQGPALHQGQQHQQHAAGRFMHPHQAQLAYMHPHQQFGAHPQQQQQQQQQGQQQGQQGQQQVLFPPHMGAHAMQRIAPQPGLKVGAPWMFAPTHLPQGQQGTAMQPQAAGLGKSAAQSSQHVPLISPGAAPQQQQQQQQQQLPQRSPASQGMANSQQPQHQHQHQATIGASGEQSMVAGMTTEGAVGSAGGPNRRSSYSGTGSANVGTNGTGNRADNGGKQTKRLLFSPMGDSPSSTPGSPGQGASMGSPQTSAAAPLVQRSPSSASARQPSRSLSESVQEFRPFSRDPAPYVPSQHRSPHAAPFPAWASVSTYSPRVSGATSASAGMGMGGAVSPGSGAPGLPAGVGVTSASQAGGGLPQQASAPAQSHVPSSSVSSFGASLSPLDKPQGLGPLLDTETLSDAAIQHALGEFQDTLDSDFSPLPDEAAMRRAWDASTGADTSAMDSTFNSLTMDGLLDAPPPSLSTSNPWSMDVTAVSVAASALEPPTSASSNGTAVDMPSSQPRTSSSSTGPSPSSAAPVSSVLSQLFDSAKSGSVEAFRSLLNSVGQGPNVQEPGSQDGLLHVAIRYSNRAVASLLLQDAGLDMLSTNVHGNTFLHEAASVGDTTNLPTLLARSANDVHVTWNRAGQAPIHTAISFGHGPFVKQYLSLAPHAINVRAKDGKTPLHCAVQRLDLDALKVLLAVPNCDTQAQTNTGESTLHLAVGSRAPKPFLRYLMQHAAVAVDARNDSGDTALHVAAAEDATDALDYLLQQGASTHLQNKAGQTAEDVSRMGDRPTHRAIYERYVRRCSNCGVKDGTPGINLRSCANCHVKLYCSKTCQEKDWYSQHSHECDTLREQYEQQRQQPLDA